MKPEKAPNFSSGRSDDAWTGLPPGVVIPEDWWRRFDAAIAKARLGLQESTDDMD